MKKLIPAICMFLIAASMLGTSTFAWFSMNDTVTVTGMEVTTKVPDSILIATSKGNDTVTSTDANKDADGNATDYYGQNVQKLRAKLEPVSTIDGLNYYYTDGSNVKVSGDTILDTFTAYNPAATADPATSLKPFESAYGTEGAVAYIDYVVMLKATNTNVADKYINLSALNLTYGGTDTLALPAFRVAVFVQDASTDGTVASTNTLVAILEDTTASTGSVYFSDVATYTIKSAETVDEVETDKAWSVTIGSTTLYMDKATVADAKFYTGYDDSTNEFSGEVTPYVTISTTATASEVVAAAPVAVSDTAKFAKVQNLDKNAIIGKVDGNTTHYYKVTVRLWIEGEDKACKNDIFAKLDDAWALDLAFDLKNDNTTAVAKIAVDKTASKMTIDLGKDSTTLSTLGENNYFQYTSSDSGAKTIYSLDAEIKKDSRFFTIDGNKVTEVTNQVEIQFELKNSLGHATATPDDASNEHKIKLDVNKDLRVVYKAESGYKLPATITVTIGGSAATAGTDYTWNENTGVLTILKAKITGNIVVTVTADTE